MSDMQIPMEAQKPELSEGVKLVLDRMESNPEEFECDIGEGKWGRMLAVVHARMFSFKAAVSRPPSEPWLTQYEVEAIWNGYVKVQQNKFHRHVMEKILDDGEAERKETRMAYPQMTQQLNMHHNTLSNNIQPGGIGYYNAAQSAVSGTAAQGATTSVSPKTFWEKLIK